MDQPPTWAELEALHHAGLVSDRAGGGAVESSEQELAAAQALANIAGRPPS